VSTICYFLKIDEHALRSSQVTQKITFFYINTHKLSLINNARIIIISVSFFAWNVWRVCKSVEK